MTNDDATLAEVNELIDCHASWGRIRPQFQCRAEMLAYAARRLAMRHGIERASGACEVCGAASNSSPASFTWQYCINQASVGPWTVLELLVGHFPIPVETQYHRFDTYHQICLPCGQRARRRYFIGTILQPIALFLFSAGLMLSIVWAICMALSPSGNAQQAEIERMGTLGLPALAIGLVASRIVNVLRIPKPLRCFQRRPFGLHKVVWGKAVGPIP